MGDLIRRIVETAFIDGYDAATGGERPDPGMVANVVYDHVASLESDLTPVEIVLDPSRGVYVVLADLTTDENVVVTEGPAYLVKRNPNGGTP